MNKTFKNTKTGEIISINTSEDWEEVVEKDYEILSFKCTTGKRITYTTLRDNGFYVESSKSPQDTPSGKGATLNYMLYDWVESPNEKCEIYSIKRLSDGEILTIGDKIKLPNGDIEIIKEIEVDGNYIELYYAPDTVVSNDGKNWFEKIQHVKPLFTTEDGVDIYESNEYWYVDDNIELFHTSQAIKSSGQYPFCKYFSTKKAAENYIKCHKPCLSYNEVLDLLNDTITSRETVKKRLNLLIKTKLNE